MSINNTDELHILLRSDRVKGPKIPIVSRLRITQTGRSLDALQLSLTYNYYNFTNNFKS